MKIQTKATVGILSLGVVGLLTIFLSYQYLANRTVIQDSQQRLMPLALELSQHVQSLLEGKIEVVKTLATSPVLKQALQQSNTFYSEMEPENRTAAIKRVDEQWRNSSAEDPFVQSHMLNNAALLLKAQQKQLPNMYGEIFLTNQYGAMIATTGKLSTLAHAYKYWWKGAYADGKGAIFIDDRGYDNSVEDVVVGIVIPITEKGNIIGILKANLLVAGPLGQLVESFNQRQTAQLYLARSRGMIISGEGKPLSSRLPNPVVELMANDKSTSATLGEPYDVLVATAPVPISLGDKGYRFGGTPKSIDQAMGNRGESWHVVTMLDLAIALQTARDNSRLILSTGFLYIVLSVAAALLIGRSIVKPIQNLTRSVRRIGKGELDTRIRVKGNDEVAMLANSFNHMIDRLSKTMASRDVLTREIERRKEVEQKLTQMATTDDLTGAYNRRFFCSHVMDEISRAERYQEPLSLIMFDADYFKKVNDQFGHDAGDQVLKNLVKVATMQLRIQDTLCRWGGEEFMILLPHTQLKDATHLAERLRIAVENYDFGKPKHVTISLGITEYQSGDTNDMILKRVDDALYQAKESGRNRVVAIATTEPTEAKDFVI